MSDRTQDCKEAIVDAMLEPNKAEIERHLVTACSQMLQGAAAINRMRHSLKGGQLFDYGFALLSLRDCLTAFDGAMKAVDAAWHKPDEQQQKGLVH